SCGGGRRAAVVGGEAVEEVVQVLGGVGPVERSGGEVVALLEGRQPVVDLGQVGEVVGGDDLALHHGEVDFALVQPARVDGGVDQGGGGPRLGHAVDGCLAAVGGTVVDPPEHPPGPGVRFDRHDLFDQAGERGDAGGRLAPAEDLAAVGVPGGQVGPGTAPPVIRVLPPRGGP